MYRRLLATMSPLTLYVRHYGGQYFVDFMKKKLFLIKAVFISIFVVVLC